MGGPELIVASLWDHASVPVASPLARPLSPYPALSSHAASLNTLAQSREVECQLLGILTQMKHLVFAAQGVGLELLRRDPPTHAPSPDPPSIGTVPGNREDVPAPRVVTQQGRLPPLLVVLRAVPAPIASPGALNPPAGVVHSEELAAV